MIVDKRRKIIYFHIPRTGGTFIQKNLMKQLGCTAKEYWGEPKKNRSDLSHLHQGNVLIYTNLSERQFRNFHKFCLVRNPYERLYSAYLARATRIHGGPISFPAFMRKYIREPWIRKAWLIWFRPMVDFIYRTKSDGTKEKMMNTIHRFENLGEEIAAIKARLGVKGDFGTVKKAKQTRAKEDWRSKYTPATIRLVNRIYREDFEKLGYEMVDPKVGFRGHAAAKGPK